MQKTIAAFALSAMGVAALKGRMEEHPFGGENWDKEIIDFGVRTTHRATRVPDVFQKYDELITKETITYRKQARD